MSQNADYAPPHLSLVEVNRGPDDDGNLVINYEVRRGNIKVASFQSTRIDVAVWVGKTTNYTTVVCAHIDSSEAS